VIGLAEKQSGSWAVIKNLATSENSTNRVQLHRLMGKTALNGHIVRRRVVAYRGLLAGPFPKNFACNAFSH
jgi:hypothetical protein